MSLTIVLSGPERGLGKAQSALTASGYHICQNVDAKGVAHPQHDWGHSAGHETEWTGQRYQKGDIKALDETAPGHGHTVGDIVPHTGEFVAKPPKEPVAFVTVEGEDIDRASAVVESLGWRLRGHWNEPEPSPPPPTALDILRNIRPESREKFLAELLELLKAGE